MAQATDPDQHIHASSPGTTVGGPSAGFVVFSACWAVYTLVHQLLTYAPWFRFDDPAELSINLLVSFSAIAVLMNPASLKRFVLMCALAFGLKFMHMPFVANHLFFTMLVNLVIVLAIGTRWIWPAVGRHPADAAYDTFAPTLRASLIVLYFWVVVHKLNWDYLNPVVSCGFELYVTMGEVTKARTGLGLVPVADWMAYPCLLGALAIEAMIPLLIWFRRTRKAAIALGLLFHLMLTLHSNEYIASFSCVLYAMYTLFLPGDIRENWVGAWKQSGLGRRLISQPLLVPAITVVVFVVCCAAVVVLSLIHGRLHRDGLIEDLHLVFPFVAMLVFYLWALICIALFIRGVSRPWHWEGRAMKAYRPAQIAFIAFPLLLLLNGLSPYLGLKTHHAMAMFSNLRTEAGISNHLFLPSSIRLANWQDDEVVVLASNHDWSIKPNEPGQRYTWFEFTRAMSQVSDGVEVTYQRGDSLPVTVSRAATPDDPSFTPPAYVLRKLFLLKEIPRDDEPCPCRH
ncbi:MAG: hypothetical protein AAGC44_02740 [Planctomycetota bacterium]